MTASDRTPRRRLGALGALIVLVALPAAPAPAAAADPPFGASSFQLSACADASASTGGPCDSPSTQAAGHPYEVTTAIALNSVERIGPNGSLAYTSVEDLRDAVVDLPLGFLGSALAAPTCTFAQLSSHISAGVAGCPSATVVGHIYTAPQGLASVNGPIYNLVPEGGGIAAEFGFADNLGAPHVIYASVAPTPAGYALRVTTPSIAQISLTDILVNFYGNPAARDASGSTPVAMFTNPADCSGEEPTTGIHLDSWQNPGSYNADGTPNFSDPAWASASSASPPVVGCNQLQFHPTISAKPTTAQADSPSGLDVTLSVPQNSDPNGLATPPLRKAVVTLPAGITVNPSSANGLAGCSLADLGMSTSGEPNASAPNCPDSAKIGTVEVSTPLLANPLPGSIYLAKQNANPSGSLIALYIVVDDPITGTILKLPGKVTTDPATGQLTTVFDQSPQLPFSQLKVHLFAGSRAPLRTPATCGTYTTTSELTPWSAPDSGPPATPSDSFQITSGPNGAPCANTPADQPNDPSLQVGTITPIAGAYSPFGLEVTRNDGSQQLKGLTLTLPPGLIGKLAGIPYCPEAALKAAEAKSGTEEQSSPSCPVASQIGTVTVGAGAGEDPFYVQGHAYLAGPYKNASLSVAIVTPALAGPFDLGTVVVRAALSLDPTSAQVTVKSDPIPTILDGIPLDLRDIRVNMDRPQFTLNPTSCDPLAVSGTALSVLDQSAGLSDRFQVGACNALGFKPKLGLKVSGGTHRGSHPALRAVLTMKPGEANIARAQVTLPHGEFLDNAHIRTVCTRVQFAAQQCPAGSVLGFARAVTPLLDQPLEGPVYLMSGFGHKLPDLAADLNGQIRVLLHGKVDTGKNHGIRNTFEVVPDAPVRKFTLSLAGGNKGLLVNSEDICAKAQKAIAHFTAQNGKVSDFNPVVNNDCGSKAKEHRHHHR